MTDHVKVVLIGPDCGGKTSIANGLRYHYGLEGSGNRRIPGDLEAIRSVVNFALDEIPNRGFILDQWQFPVDIIYRIALESEMSPIHHITSVLVPHLSAHNVLFLHVTARNEILAQRFEQRGDELWNLEQILTVAEVYREIHNMIGLEGLNVKQLDTSDLNIDIATARAIQIIDRFYLEVNP